MADGQRGQAGGSVDAMRGVACRGQGRWGWKTSTENGTWSPLVSGPAFGAVESGLELEEVGVGEGMSYFYCRFSICGGEVEGAARECGGFGLAGDGFKGLAGGGVEGKAEGGEKFQEECEDVVGVAGEFVLGGEPAGECAGDDVE